MSENWWLSVGTVSRQRKLGMGGQACLPSLYSWGFNSCSVSRLGCVGTDLASVPALPMEMEVSVGPLNVLGLFLT